MLFLNPMSVTLLGKTLDNVTALAVERLATKAVVEWSDGGPHPVFADAPEQKTTITLTRVVAQDEATPARPGDQGALTFRVGAGADDAGNRSYTATVVVMGVGYDLTAKAGAKQTIEMVAVASAGGTDPVAEAGSGA